jgi:hypothetical protein
MPGLHPFPLLGPSKENKRRGSCSTHRRETLNAYKVIVGKPEETVANPNIFNFNSGVERGELNWVHSALRPPMACCTSPG